MALLVSERGTCVRRKVGCILVNKKNHVLATGYNGTPPGIKNCFEGGCKRCKDRMDGKIKSGEGLSLSLIHI